MKTLQFIIIVCLFVVSSKAYAQETSISIQGKYSIQFYNFDASYISQEFSPSYSIQIFNSSGKIIKI